MSICPFAVQQIIPESHTQGAIRPTTLILHRAVSSAESLQGYWNSPGVELESHFYVGQYGVLYQFVDTNVRADANMSANGFAISVETWDGGNTPDSMPWNSLQLATLKRLAAWVCETHGVPRRAATSWNGGGIGGHNWFSDEWAGGPRRCPGTARNNQIRNDIIPFVANGGGSSAPTEGPDVNDLQDEMLRNLQFGEAGKFKMGRVGQAIADTSGNVAAIKSDLAAFKATVTDALTQLSAQIAKISTSGVAASVDYAQVAKSVNDDADRRDRDNDPKTGAVS